MRGCHLHGPRRAELTDLPEKASGHGRRAPPPSSPPPCVCRSVLWDPPSIPTTLGLRGRRSTGQASGRAAPSPGGADLLPHLGHSFPVERTRAPRDHKPKAVHPLSQLIFIPIGIQTPLMMCPWLPRGHQQLKAAENEHDPG